MTDHAFTLAFDDATIGVMITLAIPLFGAAAYIIHYFWKRARCVDTLATRVESWEDDAARDRETHKDIYNRLNHIDRNVARILGFLDGPDRK